ncbi:MAG: hypothetical protein QF521_15115 [Alphaproteobacteria bacterium]|jgi:hypothetical protein|nr:hypothetical protein [Alphaproteobacteria bacterium]
MGAFLLVWLLSTLAVVAAVYLVKSLRHREFCRVGDFHWPGLIVIALILGAVPAFAYYNLSSRAVQVPDGVAERPKIASPEKN